MLNGLGSAALILNWTCNQLVLHGLYVIWLVRAGPLHSKNIVDLGRFQAIFRAPALVESVFSDHMEAQGGESDSPTTRCVGQFDLPFGKAAAAAPGAPDSAHGLPIDASQSIIECHSRS